MEGVDGAAAVREDLECPGLLGPQVGASTTSVEYDSYFYLVARRKDRGCSSLWCLLNVGATKSSGCRSETRLLLLLRVVVVQDS